MVYAKFYHGLRSSTLKAKPKVMLILPIHTLDFFLVVVKYRNNSRQTMVYAEFYHGGQFYFTGTGSTVFDNCRKLSRRYEIINRVINGGKPPTPINSIPVYYNKNKTMESLKTLIMLSPKSRTGKVKTSLPWFEVINPESET